MSQLEINEFFHNSNQHIAKSSIITKCLTNPFWMTLTILFIIIIIGYLFYHDKQHIGCDYVMFKYSLYLFILIYLFLLFAKNMINYIYSDNKYNESHKQIIESHNNPIDQSFKLQPRSNFNKTGGDDLIIKSNEIETHNIENSDITNNIIKTEIDYF